MKPTVTIGIPAYNEEANIEHLLLCLLRQRQDTFVLERILVISDGSQDKTATNVRTLMANYPRIWLVDEPKRQGKAARLEQLYQMNTSDFIITFDADITLANGDVLEEMVAIFINDAKACLVAAHQLPVKPQTRLGNIVYASHQLWDEVRLSLEGGGSIHNMYGAACALRNNFAKSVHFPHGAMCDNGFLYILAWQRQGFRYAKNAVVLYRVASSWEEYRAQSLRTLIVDKRILQDYFGTWVKTLYRVPTDKKWKALVKMLWRRPFATIAAVFLGVILRMSLQKESRKRKPLWHPLASTKHPITHL